MLIRNTLAAKFVPGRPGLRPKLPAGLIAALLFGLAAPSAISFGQSTPPNDNFVNATPLTGTNVTVIGSNVGATSETGEQPILGNAPGASVWWSWTAPTSGWVTISTEGSTNKSGGPLDTVLGVYTGSSQLIGSSQNLAPVPLSVSTLTSWASNDDNTSNPNNPDDVTSLVSFSTFAGVTYYIEVDGFSDGGQQPPAEGGIVLSLTETPGLHAAPWTFQTPSGSLLSSTNFAGQVVLLNIWASWCGPCADETPTLIQLQKNFGPKGVSVVGIAFDASADGVTPPITPVTTFVKNYGINYPIAIAFPNYAEIQDTYGRLPNAGDVGAFPTSFIIDRNGNIASVFVGERDYDTYAKAIQPLVTAGGANAPLLQLALAPPNIVLSWLPGAAVYRLQSAGVLSRGAWTTVTTPVQSDGTYQFVTVPAASTNQFFRLVSP